MKSMNIKAIATIHTDFSTKFGVPRQSGLTDAIRATITFEPEYATPDALKGLEGYSHIWLIWGFSEVNNTDGSWSPTVRPPKLGGNKRVGVFATRSPYRPNPIGLSSVKLDGIDFSNPSSPILHISGADLVDGTPIFDIKPYLAYTDSHAQAVGGFSLDFEKAELEVVFPEELCKKLSESKLAALKAVLSQDPRPAYHDDPKRIYGFEFSGFEVKFSVDNNRGTVTVKDLTAL